MIDRCLQLPVLFLLLISWHGLDATEPTSQTEFSEDTRVVRVEVPVTVVGRDGEPIRGLSPESFVISDQGREQEILDFEVIDLRTESQEALADPGKTAEMRRENLPPAGRRHFLLLFDLSFSKPSSIVKARQAARELVMSQLHPTDLAAVATYSLDTGPQLILTFTPDRAQLARAIDTLGYHRRRTSALRQDPLGFLIQAPEEIGDVSSNASDSLSEGKGVDLGNEATENMRVIQRQFNLAEKNFKRGRITGWSRALADMAKILNSVAGRKQVIYFSEGFDSTLVFGRKPLGRDAESDRIRLENERGSLWLRDSDETFGSVGLQQDMALMLEEFRRADCTIQAVDIAGLRTEQYGDESVGSEVLYYLANETGGVLFEDGNDLADQLGDLLERSAVTYLLSFQPTDLGEDGSYHRLKIKLRDVPGRPKVSHRAGYYAPRPFADLHPLEKNLLASDAIAAATPKKDVKVELLSAPFRASPEKSYVPIIIEVEGSTLLKDHEGDQLSVEIYAYVTDAQGEMRDFLTDRIDMRLGSNRESVSRTGLKYYGHFELGEGEHLIRVLVRNGGTGATGVATLPMEIPSFEKDKAVMLPPFFVDSPPGWVLVRESQTRSENSSVIYPFTIDGQPYIPAVMPRLSPHDQVRLCLVAYNLGRGTIELESQVLSADGELVPGGRVELMERTVTGISGLDKLELMFQAEGLESGSYSLEVSLRDPTTGSKQTSTSPFVVRADSDGS